MLYLVIGTSVGRSREEVMAVYPRHKAFVDPFLARGEIVGLGPFVDPGEGLGRPDTRLNDAVRRMIRTPVR